MLAINRGDVSMFRFLHQQLSWSGAWETVHFQDNVLIEAVLLNASAVKAIGAFKPLLDPVTVCNA
jgi:hypothetical protein